MAIQNHQKTRFRQVQHIISERFSLNEVFLSRGVASVGRPAITRKKKKKKLASAIQETQNQTHDESGQDKLPQRERRCAGMYRTTMLPKETESDKSCPNQVPWTILDDAPLDFVLQPIGYKTIGDGRPSRTFQE